MYEKIYNCVRDNPYFLFLTIGVSIYLVVRFFKVTDKNIEELYERTDDLPEIRNNIEWLNKTKKDK